MSHECVTAVSDENPKSLHVDKFLPVNRVAHPYQVGWCSSLFLCSFKPCWNSLQALWFQYGALHQTSQSGRSQCPVRCLLHWWTPAPWLNWCHRGSLSCVHSPSRWTEQIWVQASDLAQSYHWMHRILSMILNNISLLYPYSWCLIMQTQPSQNHYCISSFFLLRLSPVLFHSCWWWCWQWAGRRSQSEHTKLLVGRALRFWLQWWRVSP